MSWRPSLRPRTGFALLDLLFAVTLVSIGALAIAAPLTSVVASFDAAGRSHRRIMQLAAAADAWAAAARRGDCAASLSAFGAVSIRRAAMPPGVQLQMQVRDTSGPPGRHRADSLVVWAPCIAPAVPPVGAP